MDKPSDASSDQTEEVQVNIRMPKELRRRLKVLAASEEKPMKRKVQDWIQEKWSEQFSEAVPA